MIVSKILPVRYVNYFDTVRGSFTTNDNVHPLELADGAKIKESIVTLLFADGPKTIDYLLISFTDKLYIVERDGTTSYTKREVSYHPLMAKVSLICP